MKLGVSYLDMWTSGVTGLLTSAGIHFNNANPKEKTAPVSAQALVPATASRKPSRTSSGKRRSCLLSLQSHALMSTGVHFNDQEQPTETPAKKRSKSTLPTQPSATSQGRTSALPTHKPSLNAIADNSKPTSSLKLVLKFPEKSLEFSKLVLSQSRQSGFQDTLHNDGLISTDSLSRTLLIDPALIDPALLNPAPALVAASKASTPSQRIAPPSHQAAMQESEEDTMAESLLDSSTLKQPTGPFSTASMEEENDGDGILGLDLDYSVESEKTKKQEKDMPSGIEEPNDADDDPLPSRGNISKQTMARHEKLHQKYKVLHEDFDF
jgi:hypothetical protein